MSYNGSGTFNINSAGQPVVSGTVITSTAFNALTSDLATGLSTALTKDGQTTPTANITLGGYKITNLAAGTAAADAIRFSQLQGASTSTYITAAGTNTITGTVTPTLTAYATGQQFSFVVAATNTTAVTLNVDGVGAKAVTKTGSVALVAGDMVTGKVVIVEYDGTQFQLINGNNLTIAGTTSGIATIVTPGAAGTPTLTLPTNTGTLIADFSTPAYRNRIINGGQGIDQVNAGASQTYTAAAAVAYNVDMFYGSCTGANVTGQRVAGTTAEYAYQYTGAASVTGILHGTRIESHNVWDLTSQTATLSVTLSNSLLTTVTWTAYYANATDNFSAKTQIATGTFTVNSTPTVYSTQIAMGANAKNGVSIEFTVGAQTSGTWNIENVQLEKGASATAFDFRDYESEDARCRRYLNRKSSTLANSIGLAGGMYSGSVGVFADYFPVQMRATPTFTYDGTNANWNVALNGTTIAITSLNVSGTPGKQSALLQASCAASAGFVGFLVSLNANAWIQYDARL